MSFMLTLCHIKGPAAVSGHSCCGVPAKVLSVYLFDCLLVFGEANKIK